MEQIRILIVEDDADINHLLAKIIQKAGYEPVCAYSGSEARLRLEKDGIKEYSLILLDLMLPGMMGEELIAQIRKTSQVPILVLSARSSLEDRVSVLELGADDYLTKPFQKEEVIARVNSALRRYLTFGKREGTAPDKNKDKTGSETRADRKIRDGMEIHDYMDQEEIYEYKNLILSVDRREVYVLCSEKKIMLTLTAHEFDLLYLLMQNPGKVFSRQSLYEQVWQNGYFGEDNTVNVHISNLRKKIAAADPDTEYIKTVWGIGFKL